MSAAEPQKAYYTVSYIVQEGKHPGVIMTEESAPQVGEEVHFEGMVFKVLEVVEMVPPVGGRFGFIHATCRYLRDEADA